MSAVDSVHTGVRKVGVGRCHVLRSRLHLRVQMTSSSTPHQESINLQVSRRGESRHRHRRRADERVGRRGVRRQLRHGLHLSKCVRRCERRTKRLDKSAPRWHSDRERRRDEALAMRTRYGWRRGVGIIKGPAQNGQYCTAPTLWPGACWF